MTTNPTLLITRGYAASGKSTAAEKWVRRSYDADADWCRRELAEHHAEHVAERLASFPPLPDTPRARVNRDDLRAMLFGQSGVLAHDLEQQVSTAQRAQVRALLGAGVSVVVDDTNLRLRFARDWADLAREVGAEFYVWDFTVDREDCIYNDEKRAAKGGRKVGTLAIADMAARFPQPWPKVEPRPVKDALKALPYVPNPDLPDAWIIDIDGTLAKKRMGPGERGWHDYHRVQEDTPVADVIELVRALWRSGTSVRRPQVIVLSGRQDYCMPQTRAWLDEHLGEWHYDELYMRATGDHRSDEIVKSELFDAHVRNRFNVRGVVDDRPRVCRIWRAMGLTTLQVGDPHVEF